MAASALKHIINFGKGLGKQIGKVKPVKKVGDYIKRTAQEGSKKTVTPKPKPKVKPKVKVKEPISKKHMKMRLKKQIKQVKQQVKQQVRQLVKNQYLIEI
mgnify:CR=1 FL=1